MNMVYEVDGYYSDEAGVWTARNLEQHDVLFDIAARMNRHCHSVASILRIANSNGQHVICSALFVRALEFFQSSLVLIERGLSNPAKVMLRSFLETTFTIRAIAADVEVMRRYVAADEFERLRALRKVRQNPSAFEAALLDRNREELDELIDNLEKDDNVHRGLKIPVHELAQKAELIDTYDTAYGYLSSTVHSAVRDLEQYLELDADGEVHQMRWGPDGSDTAKLLITAIESMSHSLVAIELLFGVDCDAHVELSTEFDRAAREALDDPQSN
jgi:hypothetical protein